MTSSQKDKRIDAIEAALTPKEWAVKLADEMRKHPSKKDFLEAEKKKSIDEAFTMKPYRVLTKQADERHPGNKPEDIRAKSKIEKALRKEFHMLKLLIFLANEQAESTGETSGLEAALKLAKLQTIVLQDAFGRTARKAAEWVKEYKTADNEEEENRQIMLNELAAYSDADFGEKLSDSVPIPGGGRIRFPSFIEDWVTSVIGLTMHALGIRAGIVLIQDKLFDGHPILYKDSEAKLDASIKTLEEGIETFNAYLKTRAAIFGAEWEEEEEEEDGIASAISGEREGKLTINIASIRATVKKNKAKMWADDLVKSAKARAAFDMADENGGIEAVWNAGMDDYEGLS